MEYVNHWTWTAYFWCMQQYLHTLHKVMANIELVAAPCFMHLHDVWLKDYTRLLLRRFVVSISWPIVGVVSDQRPWQAESEQFTHLRLNLVREVNANKLLRSESDAPTQFICNVFTFTKRRIFWLPSLHTRFSWTYKGTSSLLRTS